MTDPVVMVREDRFKYISIPGAPAGLFDVVSDPEELSDLTGATRFRDVAERLAARAGARWDLARLRAEVVASQRDRRLVHLALIAGKHTPWDYSPATDAPGSYIRNV